MRISYDRVIQWVSGPFAAGAGVLASKAATHMGFLGAAGLGKNSVAHGIVTGTVFTVTALVTWASHNKWVSNLSKWWTVASRSNPPTSSNDPVINPVHATTVTVPTAADILREQVRSSGLHPEA